MKKLHQKYAESGQLNLIYFFKTIVSNYFYFFSFLLKRLLNIASY